MWSLRPDFIHARVSVGTQSIVDQKGIPLPSGVTSFMNGNLQDEVAFGNDFGLGPVEKRSERIIHSSYTFQYWKFSLGFSSRGDSRIRASELKSALSFSTLKDTVSDNREQANSKIGCVPGSL